MTEPPVVRLDGVSRIYRERGHSIAAVSGVTLSIPAGAFIVVAGPSGSGKTTLLNLMGGLDRPTSGGIAVGGIGLASLDERGLAIYRRRHVGFVFQGGNLVPTMTVYENIEFPLLLLAAEDAGAKVESLLDRVGLAHRSGAFPQDLSAGEQQRVAIARAVVHSPSIVLADEPTANLDSKTAGEIFDLLTDMNGLTGTVVILATHSEALIEKAEHTVRLLDGRVV